LRIAIEIAPCRYVAKRAKKYQEAEGLKPCRPDPCAAGVVPQCQRNECQQPEADDPKLLTTLAMSEEISRQHQQRHHDCDVVYMAEDGQRSNRRDAHHEARHDAREWVNQHVTEAAQVTRGAEVEKSGDGDQIVRGVSQTPEKHAVRHHKRQQARLQPQTISIEKCEDRQPQQKGIELASKTRDCRRNEPYRGKCSAQEEVDLVMMKDAKHLIGSERHGPRIHGTKS
jgi:hypothetical protein